MPSVPSVGLEHTFYQVNESARSVEVCAAVYPVSDCPIATSFHILLTTLDDTAGISFFIGIGNGGGGGGQGGTHPHKIFNKGALSPRRTHAESPLQL